MSRDPLNTRKLKIQIYNFWESGLLLYSVDPKTGHVWISNGRKQGGCGMAFENSNAGPILFLSFKNQIFCPVFQWFWTKWPPFCLFTIQKPDIKYPDFEFFWFLKSQI